jgi:hypothetical protein
MGGSRLLRTFREAKESLSRNGFPIPSQSNFPFLFPGILFSRLFLQNIINLPSAKQQIFAEQLALILWRSSVGLAGVLKHSVVQLEKTLCVIKRATIGWWGWNKMKDEEEDYLDTLLGTSFHLKGKEMRKKRKEKPKMKSETKMKRKKNHKATKKEANEVR